MGVVLGILFFALMIGGAVFFMKRAGDKLNKSKENLKTYEEAITKISGFKATKSIVTGYYPFGSLGVGIWLDFNSKKMAIRTATDETTPKIYPFDNIKNYEMSGDTTAISSVRKGAFGGHTVKTTTNTNSIYIKILLGGANGAETLIIPLFKAPKMSEGSSSSTKHYQEATKYANAIVDELNLIVNDN